MVTYNEIIKEIGRECRTEQRLLCDDIVMANEFGECLLAQADTGIGKTLSMSIAVKRILLTPSDKRRKIIIATSTLALCKDIQHELSSVGVGSSILMSYRNYFSRDRIELLIHKRPDLTDSLSPLISWSSTIDSYLDEFGDLPCGVTIEQVCQTEATKSEAYMAERKIALEADVIVTSHAMVAIDMLQTGRVLNLLKFQSTLIIDEADTFVDFLKEFNVRSFNLFREFSRVKELCSNRFKEHLHEQGEVIRKLVKATKAFSKEGKKTATAVMSSLQNALNDCVLVNLTMDELAEYEEFKHYYDWAVEHVSRSPDVSVSLTTINQEPVIAIYSPYFSRVFGGYCYDNIQSVVLLSGTLSVEKDVEKGTDWIKRELKLIGYPIQCKAYSPKRYGELTLSLYRSDVPIYIQRGEHLLNQAWIKDICQEILCMSGKTLIITSSFNEARLLAEHLTGNVFLHKPSEKLSLIKDAFIHAKGDAYLISPSAHTGHNFTCSNNRSVLRNIVITRLGFKASNDVLSNLKGSPDYPDSKIKHLQQADYFMSLNRVIRRTIQIIGRGIRHKDDKVNVFIADPRFPKYLDVTNSHSVLRNAIPTRFIPQYQQARIVSPIEYEGASYVALDTSIL